MEALQKWPEFIDSFHQNIHSKVTFIDNIRMTRLISSLDGDVKRAVQSIGSNGLFYASALKSLKSNFGNPLLVATFRMKTIFDKPHINGRDRIALRATTTSATKDEQHTVDFYGLRNTVIIK